MVYQVWNDRLAIFANSQNGLQNVTSRDFYGNVFLPQLANEYEGGIKYSFFNGKLSGALSYYDITVTNSIRADVLPPNFNIQDGTQNSKGIEFNIMTASLIGWVIQTGYAHNDNTYVIAAADVPDRRPV